MNLVQKSVNITQICTWYESGAKIPTHYQYSYPVRIQYENPYPLPKSVLGTNPVQKYVPITYLRTWYKFGTKIRTRYKHGTKNPYQVRTRYENPYLVRMFGNLGIRKCGMTPFYPCFHNMSCCKNEAFAHCSH